MAKPSLIIPYDPAFLGGGAVVPLPDLKAGARAHALNGGRPLDYTHFSLVMSEARRVAIYTACNLDGTEAKRLSRSGSWQLDERAGENQLGASFYDNNPWDRGHLVRRLDPVWGPLSVARQANNATFFYTNAAPQHERFNQDEWVELEDWVLDHAVDEAYRVCVFTGPVLRESDAPLKDAQIPAAFWKIIVARDGASGGRGLLATAFMMKQDLLWNDGNGAALNHLTTYQVRVSDIERVTCLDFGEEMRKADPLSWEIDRIRKSGSEAPAVVKIRQPSEIVVWPSEDRQKDVTRSLVAVPGEVKSGCGCSSAPFEAFDAGRAYQLLSRQLTVDIDGIMSRMLRLEDALTEKLQQDDKDFAFRLGIFRIVGGTAVREGGYPDCVCVGNSSGYFCTGALIGPNVVLTAGHCTPDGIDRVYVGRSVVGSISPTSEYRVRRVVRHPSYRSLSPTSTQSRHDIAVLILDRDVTGVTPMGIIDPSTVPREDGDFPGEPPRIRLVGFGNTDRAGRYGFGIKREVEVPVLTLRRLATDIFSGVEREQGFNALTEMTAGIQDKDTCTGDSGGPAYAIGPSPVREVRGVLGLTSRGTAASRWNCGDNGIYTLAWPYKAWIEEVAAAQGGRLSWLTTVADGAHVAGAVVAGGGEGGEPPVAQSSSSDDRFEKGCC